MYISILANLVLPLTLAALLTRKSTSSTTTSIKPTQHYFLIKSFSLLILGLFLSTLATLNFSLSFMIGLLCAPLTFINRLNPSPSPSPNNTVPKFVSTITSLIFLNLLSPPVVLLAGCWYAGVDVETVLTQAAFGWDVWGMWTQVVVWGVWWPAWVVGCALVGVDLLG